MENFDLKKFLVENKITTNSRLIEEEKSLDEGFLDKITTGIGKLATGVKMYSLIPSALDGDTNAEDTLVNYFSQMSPEKQNSFIEFFKKNYIDRGNVPTRKKLAVARLISRFQDDAEVLDGDLD